MTTSILGKPDYTMEEVQEILEGARSMVPVAVEAYRKINRGAFPPAIKMFEDSALVSGNITRNTPPTNVIIQILEESTRTAGSFRRAAKNLGLDPVVIHMAATSRGGKGESPLDDAEQHMIQGAGIYILRTSVEGEPKFLAEKLQSMGYQISVINAGDGKHRHPTQGRLDLLTLDISGKLKKGMKIGIGGDLKYGRTVHSILSVLKPFEPEVSLVPFGGLELESPYRDGLNIVGEEEGNLELLLDCDVIYLTRVQQKRIAVPTDFDRIQRVYITNLAFLERAKKGCIIMHPGPRRGEISDEIRRDPRLVMSAQAWLGIPERMNEIWIAATQHKPVQGFSRGEVEILSEENKPARTKPGTMTIGSPERGTVIDHLPAGAGDMIKALLRKAGWVNSEQTVPVSDFVDSPGRRCKKDIIVVHGDFISNEAGALITLLAPDATINHIRGDGILTKMKFAPAKGICGLCQCHNGDCITNHDGEAETRFLVRDEKAICYWCETIHNLPALIGK
ncbi:MAG: aspartate carbamoyltransferase regulatory subunit [Patescibacteria group bacterium]|nr:aspartate carbamoyltransferase regulatory subunit [Patescibacteria group bacterium]